MAQVVYFTAIWYILWKISALYGHLVYFSHFGMLYQEKSGNPDLLETFNRMTRRFRENRPK
jgi:hypothetical protein